MRRSRFHRLISCSTALATWTAIASPAFANPQNGAVVAGSATITTAPKTVTINQFTNNAIINWFSFNIAPGETTQFIQPGVTSTTLNRVIGGGGSSQIYGTLTANGRVFIVNPDGIVFGKGAVVNVGGLIATTHDIANSDFMAGRYLFTTPGNPTASIVNEGTITAATGGFAALVAPGVRNSGTITANLGTVALGAGNGFTLDFYGDQLINLKVSGDIAGNVRDAATGRTMQDLVSNTGKLKANGGTVQMTAATAQKVVNSVINNTGVIEANSIGTKNGEIILGAQTEAMKTASAPVQVVKVSGRLLAKGKKPGSSGGKIQVAGESIQLVGAKLDASDRSGGGKILVGGDFKGGAANAPAVTLLGQSFETTSIPTATNVTVDAASTLNASAITSGNGGKIVVWSDKDTIFNGSISATGGTFGGNGGFAEVSGKNGVTFGGIRTNFSAAKGTPGKILFDPTNFVIDATNAPAIEGILNQGTDAIYTADQNITIAANTNILKTSGGDATFGLFAGAGITVQPNVTIGSSSGKLNLWFEADAGNAVLFTASAAGPIPASVSPNAVTVAALASAVLYSDSFPNGLPTSFRAPPPPVVDRSGQSLLNALSGPASSFSFLTPEYRAAFLSAYQNVQIADVVADPSVRLYTNGGTISVWGNHYTLGATRALSFPVTAADLPSPIQAAFAKVACPNVCGGYGYAQWTSSNGGDVSGSGFVATDDVMRSQTALPAGVVSGGPIPGGQILSAGNVSTRDFNSIYKLLQPFGYTPNMVFRLEGATPIIDFGNPYLRDHTKEIGSLYNPIVVDLLTQSIAGYVEDKLVGLLTGRIIGNVGGDVLSNSLAGQGLTPDFTGDAKAAYLRKHVQDGKYVFDRRSGIMYVRSGNAFYPVDRSGNVTNCGSLCS